MAPWASAAAAAGEAPPTSVDYLAAVHAVEGGATSAAELEAPYGLGGLPTPGSRMLLQRQQPHQGPKVGGWVGSLLRGLASWLCGLMSELWLADMGLPPCAAI